MTIALIYNVKAESSSPTVGQPHPSVTIESTSTNHGQHTKEVSSPRVLAVHERSNDLYAEWDTMETISAVRTAIAERYRVSMIEANEQAYQKIQQIRPSFVFNIAEGLYGVSREAQIPAILEMLRIPYLGSDPLTLAVCLDKSRAKEILSYHRVPTSPFMVIHTVNECENVTVGFPAIVKPLHEGSSKGIYNSCVVRTAAELEREVRTVLAAYRQPALVEEFLPGREFTVALLGNGDDVQTLPIVEIKFDVLPQGVNPIYSYEAKWVWDSTEDPLDIFECPAALDTGLKNEIEAICKDAYMVLNCHDWSRIDVRLDGSGKPHILEINPLPGILPKPEDNSCFPKAARAAGMDYSQLINQVLDIGMRRSGLPVATGHLQSVEALQE